MTLGDRPVDAWAPLRRPVFRAVWLAAFVANLGTWMQTVGGQRLLLQHHSPTLLVPLVQSASSLPVLLVIPAGVLADFTDRRRLLLAVQAAIAGLLALLTAVGRTTPEALRLFRRLTAFDQQVLQRVHALADEVGDAAHLLVVPVPRLAHRTPVQPTTGGPS